MAILQSISLIHLLAKAAGTSISQIEGTYGHIKVEHQAELLARVMGMAKEAELDLTSRVIDDEG